MLDVVIVGGGPVGLFLACELALAGVRPVVLERLTDASQADKAHAVAGQIVRLLDDRGLYERFGGTGAPEPLPGFYFGTLPLPLDVLGADNPMFVLQINQRDIEAQLALRAAELGIEVRRGHEVRSFTQAEDHVELLVTGPDGTQETLRARYVVGCDGGHSEIRKQSGIAFPGIIDERVISRAAIAATGNLTPTSTGTILVNGGAGGVELPGMVHRTERGVIMVAFFNPDSAFITTLEWEDNGPESYPGPGAPMTLAELEASVERVLGTHVPLSPPPAGTPDLLRRIRGRNTRLAERYRDRRIFLAGDAAHVHAASGGPGLNLGLQDAANLAWKIAADLHGWAPDGLLDSYQAERRALGERVFMQTQSQTALMAPGSDVTALRALFTELLTRRENVRAIADLMAGTDIRYDMGEPEPAPATGWFAPDLEVKTEDGQLLRLAELRRDARPLLLDLTGGAALAEVTSAWSDRVDHLPAHASGPSLLIRPDGYVAWSGTEPDGLRAALHRWFGTPLPAGGDAA